MKVSQLIKKDTLFIEDSFTDTDELYQYFSKHLKSKDIIGESQLIKRLFIKRENLGSTAIGKGVATPHIFSDKFKDFFISLGLIRNGMPYKAPDNQDVFLVFLIMSNDQYVSYHLKTLASIARMVSNTKIVNTLKSSKDITDLYNKFEEIENQFKS